MARAMTMQPATKTLQFQFASEELRYIDIGQCLSIVNRRFYRQGMQYAVAGIKIQSLAPAAAGSVVVSKLPETWVVSGSWEKSMSKWREQQNRALDDMGARETKGRYNDYKVHVDTNHVSVGFANNKIPTDSDYASFILGEWEPSQVVIPNDGGVPGNTSEYLVKMLGISDAASKSIINGYVHSRNFPQSPDPATPTVSTSWLNELHDDGETHDEVVENATDRNDELPYSQTVYPGTAGNAPGTEIVSTSIFSPTTVSQTNRLAGFIAPCGLLKVNATVGCILTIYLAPGFYKGVAASPMQDM